LLFESGDAQLSIWVMPALVPVDELVHVATQLAATTKQLTQETKAKEALAMQLAATVSHCADPPTQAAGAERCAARIAARTRAHACIAPRGCFAAI
jgi:hypothetical protein